MPKKAMALAQSGYGAGCQMSGVSTGVYPAGQNLTTMVRESRYSGGCTLKC